MHNDHPTDNQLLLAFSNGDNSAMESLLTRYKSLVNALARPYFLEGGEYEDLVQEGMIGLYKAVLTYDIQDQTKFSSYAYTCIKSKILDVIKTANRDKHKPLNNSVPITLHNESISAALTPEDLAIEKDYKQFFISRLKERLSPLEYSVFEDYLGGESYVNIATTHNLTYKKTDNILQKIKRIVKVLNSEYMSYISKS